MKLLELIHQLIDLHKAHGNIEVILQSDQEGNGYQCPRGAEFTFVTPDFDATVDTQEEAVEYGARPCIVVYP